MTEINLFISAFLSCLFVTSFSNNENLTLRTNINRDDRKKSVNVRYFKKKIIQSGEEREKKKRILNMNKVSRTSTAISKFLYKCLRGRRNKEYFKKTFEEIMTEIFSIFSKRQKFGDL